MARKKEVIEKEWIKAEAELDNALKGSKGDDAKEKDIAITQAKYDAWLKLIVESEKKVGEWKNEKDKERLAFMARVKTARTKMVPNYEKAVNSIPASVVVNDMILDIGTQEPQFEAVGALLNDVEDAIKKKNADVAAQKHAVAISRLKPLAFYGTKQGINTQVKNLSSKYKCGASSVDLSHPKLKQLITDAANAYKSYSLLIEDLADEVDTLRDDLMSSATSSNTNPQYQANLKEAVELYKGVANRAKQTLTEVKAKTREIPAIGNQLGGVTPDTVDAFTALIVKNYGPTRDKAEAIDQHIQDTIRTSSSTYVKQLDKWGISSEDRNKILKVPMEQAFALNKRIKAERAEAKQALTEMLEDIVARFNNNKAKAMISKM